MNQKLKNRGQLLHQASPTDNQNVAVIHSLLNQWGADSSLASEFSQALEWYEFELGDDLLSDRALPYQVRAVSSGIVARMPKTQLNQWFERLRELQNHLVSIITQRQRLLFLKTTTELAEIPSQDLQQLLPYLDAEKIPAGEPLIQSTPADAGRFWLRSGEIESQGNDTPPPDIGDSWGYPQTIPEDWITGVKAIACWWLIRRWGSAKSLAKPFWRAGRVMLYSSNQRNASKRLKVKKSPLVNLSAPCPPTGC